TRQVRVGEGEDEELVRVVAVADRRLQDREKVVVVGNEQGVPGGALPADGGGGDEIGGKGDAFQLGRDLGRGGTPGGGQGPREGEEQGLGQRKGSNLGDRRGGRASEASDVGDVGGSGDVDDVEALEPRLRANRVGATLTVAFVDQELMVVDGEDVADSGLGPGVELVRVLVGRVGPDVNDH